MHDDIMMLHADIVLVADAGNMMLHADIVLVADIMLHAEMIAEMIADIIIMVADADIVLVAAFVVT